MAIDGTRKTLPASYSSMSRANRPGVNCGAATAVAAESSALTSMVCPALVPTGKACRKWREWRSGRRRSSSVQPCARLPWVAVTPLGVPVVPEV